MSRLLLVLHVAFLAAVAWSVGASCGWMTPSPTSVGLWGGLALVYFCYAGAGWFGVRLRSGLLFMYPALVNAVWLVMPSVMYVVRHDMSPRDVFRIVVVSRSWVGTMSQSIDWVLFAGAALLAERSRCREMTAQQPERVQADDS